MRMPYDSLDDFVSGIAAPKAAELPAMRWLRFTGEFEVLKPLVNSEEFAEHLAAINVTSVSPTPEVPWFLGFRRSLPLVGSFAMVVLILASGIFIGTYRPSAESVDKQSDVAVDQQSEDTLANPDQQPGDILGLVSNLSIPSTPAGSPSVSDEPHAVRSVIRPGSPGPRVLRAVYRSRRITRRPQITMTDFVPTTLIIYAENGEIKTRIEPQLTSSYKKPLALPN